ncbi:hypothetical protein DFH09DRAFT_1145820, partial [Mycena vulgaris]
MSSTVARPRFTEKDDDKLIAFLADPGRIYEDPMGSQVYKPLGPGSTYKWSLEHKANAWQRRATLIEDLDGQILRVARKLQNKEGDEPKATSKKEKKPVTEEEKPKKKQKAKTVALTVVPKSMTGKKAHLNDHGDFDLQPDIDQISEDTRLPSTVVLKAVVSTGSIMMARELLTAIRDAADGQSEEEDEEAEFEEVKPKAKVKAKAPAFKKPFTKRQNEDDDGEEDNEQDENENGSSSEEERAAPKTKPKTAVAKRKPTAKPASKRRRSDDSDDEGTAAAKKKAQGRRRLAIV